MDKIEKLRQRLKKLTSNEVDNLYKGFSSKKRCSQITGMSEWGYCEENPQKAKSHEIVFLAKKLKVSPYSLIVDYNIRENIHPSLQNYFKQTKDCKLYE